MAFQRKQHCYKEKRWYGVNGKVGIRALSVICIPLRELSDIWARLHGDWARKKMLSFVRSLRLDGAILAIIVVSLRRGVGGQNSFGLKRWLFKTKWLRRRKTFNGSQRIVKMNSSASSVFVFVVQWKLWNLIILWISIIELFGEKSSDWCGWLSPIEWNSWWLYFYFWCQVRGLRLLVFNFYKEVPSCISGLRKSKYLDLFSNSPNTTIR